MIGTEPANDEIVRRLQSFADRSFRSITSLLREDGIDRLCSMENTAVLVDPDGRLVFFLFRKSLVGNTNAYPDYYFCTCGSSKCVEKHIVPMHTQFVKMRKGGG